MQQKKSARKVEFGKGSKFDESRFRKGTAFDAPTSDEEIQRLLQHYKQKSKTMGKRENRDAPTVLTNIGKFGNSDSSYYKQNFLDIIINGNYRVKYIPSAAKSLTEWFRLLFNLYEFNSLQNDFKPTKMHGVP